MDSVVRRYIVRILLLHLAFLIAVAAVIASAGVALYATARADAESAALERVAVPANQTKDLLERHFQAIFDTMRLAERTGAGAQPPTVEEELWDQLRGHLSGLMEIEPTGLRMIAFRSDASGVLPLAPDVDGDDPIRLLYSQERPPSGGGIQSRELGQRLVADAAPFLAQVVESKRPSVSGVLWLHGVGEGGQPSRTPVIIAAVPLLGPVSAQANAGSTESSVRAVLAGVVPISYLENNFLLPASQAERSGMLLFDSNGRLVAGGGDALAGKTVEEMVPKQLPASLAAYIRNTIYGGTSDIRLDLAGRVDIAGNQFESALATARPVRVGDRAIAVGPGGTDETGVKSPYEARDADEREGGLQSALDATSPLRKGKAPMWLIALVNREAVVAPLAQTARTAVLWAGAMVLAVSALLLSTSIQLIRGRSRLERLRTEMLDRELREARQIQLMWLPADSGRQTPLRQIEIAAENIPASHISGDFYNFFDLPDGRTAMVIGDVTGHGLVAAFLMATTQLLVRTALQRLGDPGKALEDVNNQLCSQSYHGQFVTIQLLVIEPDNRQMLAASAGHPPPLACGEDGIWRALPLEPQLVLGVLADCEYPTQTLPLAGAQALLLYTDGVIEVKNSQEQRFNLDLLLEQMNQSMGAACPSAKQVIERTFGIVHRFAEGTPQDDDLTLVAAHLSPSSAPASRNERSAEPGRSDTGSRSEADRHKVGSA